MALLFLVSRSFPGFRLPLRVQTLSDNTGAEAGSNKLFTTSFPQCLFVEKLCLLAACTCTEMDVSHIPGADNEEADALSSIRSTCAEDHIMMEPAEIDVLKAFLHPEVVMFEFGAGGSTVAFSELVKELYVAEHNPSWAQEVKERCDARGIRNVHLLSALPNRSALEQMGATDCGILRPQLVFDKADPLRKTYGPNLDPKWRDASPAQREAVFKDYLKLIQEANQSRFDVVLIDGRVRGECALAALPYVDERSVVIIHDWFLEEWGYEFRPDGTQDLSKPVKVAPRGTLKSYRRVLDFYDILCRVSPETHPVRCSCAGLVVLRKKMQSSA
ncbi:unnamed protein product [Durusdinium trenchii]|uniref:Uncharacterized protein n=3 Tax=Durusdinium trenchii TaxID=1381693 RepID=A0ABP0LBT9_9DINO